MAAPIQTIMGTSVRVYIGSVLWGCATSIKITAKVKKLDVNCQGSGTTDIAFPGNLSYTFSVSGLYRQFDSSDEATNISVKDQITSVQAGTEVTIKAESVATGGDVLTGVGYFDSLDLDMPYNEVAKFASGGWLNSLVLSAKA
jgi:hypothetical protein